MFEVLTPSAAGWTRAPIAGLPQIGVANLWPLDVRTEESNGDLLASVQDPLTPAVVAAGATGQRRPKC